MGPAYERLVTIHGSYSDVHRGGGALLDEVRRLFILHDFTKHNITLHYT